MSAALNVLQQALAALVECRYATTDKSEKLADAAIAALESAIAQPVQLDFEIVGYQFQWTNPANNTDHDGVLTKWAEVVPGWNQTVQQRIDEFLAYSYSGKPTYRVRALYTPTNIAQPEQPATLDTAAMTTAPALPPLGPHDHPEPWTMKWTELEMQFIREYALAAIAAAQAAKIKDERESFLSWIETRPGHPFAGQFSNLMWASWKARAAIAATKVTP